MVTVEFAPALRRHVDCEPQQVPPGTLRTALEQALQAAPALAGYVFDDQRAVFVNRELVADRVRLDRALVAGDRVLVVQALSGG
jgi:molybdopterin synthase sulfur carrier subunit